MARDAVLHAGVTTSAVRRPPHVSGLPGGLETGTGRAAAHHAVVSCSENDG